MPDRRYWARVVKSRGSLLLSCVAGAFAIGRGAPALPTPDAGAPKSLAEALQDELGAAGSVAVLGSYEGLIALSVDGKRRRMLVPGRIFDVSVDNRSEAIWYRADRTGRTGDFMVLDLREAEIHPVLVIPTVGLTEEPTIAYEDPAEVSPPLRS